MQDENKSKKGLAEVYEVCISDMIHYGIYSSCPALPLFFPEFMVLYTGSVFFGGPLVMKFIIQFILPLLLKLAIFNFILFISIICRKNLFSRQIWILPLCHSRMNRRKRCKFLLLLKYSLHSWLFLLCNLHIFSVLMVLYRTSELPIWQSVVCSFHLDFWRYYICSTFLSLSLIRLACCSRNFA